jgi:hypothetical protein
MPQSSWGSGWYPTEEWLPSKWPPYDREPTPWQLKGSAPPPPDAIIPWWLDRNNPSLPSDKSTWPYQPVPWGYKVFGSFSPRNIKMREDIGAPVDDGPPKPWPPSNIWPTVAFPKPAGLAQVNTRPDGIWGKTPSVNVMNVRMLPDVLLDVSPHPNVWAQGKLEAALREMTRKRPIRIQTEEGSITIKSMRHSNWRQHAKAQNELREALKARREERYREMLAAEIVRTRGEPRPHADLF